MAVINSFTKNGTSSNFEDADLTNYTILNGGNINGVSLQYQFTIPEVSGHTINYIVLNSVLSGGYCTISLRKNTSVLGTFSGNITSQPYGIKFDDENRTEEASVTLTVSVTSEQDITYGLQGFDIYLYDIPQILQVRFSGPLENRNTSNIDVGIIQLAQGVDPVSFSKNPVGEYDAIADNVTGRVYFRKSGIYVDGYQYGVANDASTSTRGVVKLQNTFQIAGDGGIVAPTDQGVAASPQLVYNVLGNLKNYVDDNAQKPISIDTEEEDPVSLKEGFTFSTDFEKDEQNKIYLKWKDLI